LPTKHQKFKFSIDPRYSREEKELIAQDVIDYIVKRTKQRKDKNGDEMAGYSKAYAKSPEAQAAGKKVGQAANLTLSGDLLYALGEYKKIGKSYIEIGYEKGSEENGKADGNIRGTYGTNIPNPKKARDFLGINEKELNSILADYPIDEDEPEIVSAVAQQITDKTAKTIEANLLKAVIEAYGLE